MSGFVRGHYIEPGGDRFAPGQPVLHVNRVVPAVGAEQPEEHRGPAPEADPLLRQWLGEVELAPAQLAVRAHPPRPPRPPPPPPPGGRGARRPAGGGPRRGGGGGRCTPRPPADRAHRARRLAEALLAHVVLELLAPDGVAHDLLELVVRRA